MPSGPNRADANTEDCGAASPFGRNTTMRAAPLSATNTSPFGATRMSRGPVQPDANKLTAKPAGTVGLCASVRRTFVTKFLADPPGLGGGRSCGRISRRVPGLSGVPVAERGLAFEPIAARLGYGRRGG